MSPGRPGPAGDTRRASYLLLQMLSAAKEAWQAGAMTPADGCLTLAVTSPGGKSVTFSCHWLAALEACGIVRAPGDTDLMKTPLLGWCWHKAPFTRTKVRLDQVNKGSVQRAVQAV